MNKSNDFTRRLVADFFAARLAAKSIETVTPRQIRPDANPTPLPHVKPDSSLLTDNGDPGGEEAVGSD
jgi:hypothetical protein